MIVLQTERLVLRELTAGDLDEMAALLGDPEVMRHYPRPKTRVEALDWIERSRRSYVAHGHGLWAMVLNDTGEFAGDCGLTIQDVEGTPELEVGYHVRRALWRRGLASEAAAACRDYAREALGAERIVAIVSPGNVPSQAVARKIGMELERAFVRDGVRQLLFSMPL